MKNNRKSRGRRRRNAAPRPLGPQPPRFRRWSVAPDGTVIAFEGLPRRAS